MGRVRKQKRNNEEEKKGGRKEEGKKRKGKKKGEGEEQKKRKKNKGAKKKEKKVKAETKTGEKGKKRGRGKRGAMEKKGGRKKKRRRTEKGGRKGRDGVQVKPGKGKMARRITGSVRKDPVTCLSLSCRKENKNQNPYGLDNGIAGTSPPPGCAYGCIPRREEKSMYRTRKEPSPPITNTNEDRPSSPHRGPWLSKKERNQQIRSQPLYIYA
ncbi:unnamed protein product [Prunus armeniaca]|uniref:Uncharacterized protein n=1 Tax=Prunus armeniaca TaxID=36596 RepID=A0A6J5X9I6_PRUAR|nr:unnamed protein product [Prunus armeniaca]